MHCIYQNWKKHAVRQLGLPMAVTQLRWDDEDAVLILHIARSG